MRLLPYRNILTECETYKAEDAEHRRIAGEGSILNGYQSKGYAADRDLAQLTYQRGGGTVLFCEERHCS